MQVKIPKTYVTEKSLNLDDDSDKYLEGGGQISDEDFEESFRRIGGTTNTQGVLENFNTDITVSLVGQSSVGKSSIRVRYVDGEWVGVLEPVKLTINTFQHHPRIQNLILCSNMGSKCV